MTENNNRTVSFMMRSFIFVKMFNCSNNHTQAFKRNLRSLGRISKLFPSNVTIRDSYYKISKEASTVLCFVVQHFGSGIALKKWGKTLDFVSCFPIHFFRALPLPTCFTTEQSAVEASLFVKYASHPLICQELWSKKGEAMKMN